MNVLYLREQNANTRPALDMLPRVLTVERCELSMATSSIHNPTESSNRINEKSCPECGKTFKGRGIYCSRQCYHDSMREEVEVECNNCGELFTTKASEVNRGHGQYCSKECGNKSRITQVECQCLQCGKHFKRQLSQVKMGRGKYCSKQCYNVANNKNVSRVCEQCGNAFRVSPTRLRNNNSKYCSRECYGLAKQNKCECICEECGKQFTTTASNAERGNGKYCSKGCAAKSKRGANSMFWRGGGKAYYGPNWYEQRKLAYERDGGVCQVCGIKPKKGERKNAVHHIKPRREFGGDYIVANDLSNLITLCHSCHPKAEQGIIAVPKRLL